MSNRSFIAAALLFAWAARLGAADLGQITVQASGPEIPVAPTMHGLFFEDINYAADGGLYAELIQNRSFEDHEPLFNWSEVAEGGARGKISAESDTPLNVNNTHFLRVRVLDPGRRGYGVADPGFDGIALTKGARYFFSVWAKRAGGGGGAGGLRVVLEGENSTELASVNLSNIYSSWKKYEAVLTSAATVTNARLVALATKAGTLDLDVVSLFPEKTFHGRRNGLRADLATVLADAKPGFLRFPGGCIVEGQDFANAYRWKDTIGDVAERKQNWDLWRDAKSPHYDQSYGLGFFEYFQLCEDIGAAPLPVLNCGMTCQGRHGTLVPMAELAPFAQDAVDLVEFADGPTTSPWGSKRAQMGHPKPFGLKFMAIGNEQFQQGYFDRYEVIERAVKSKYPGMQIISSAGTFVGDRNWRFAWDKFKTGTEADLVDEHYYASPRWLLENIDRYASYDRHGPKVFVGEFAGHESNRRNDLRSALAEAAYMTGLLRNADVVSMASYAPLFARAGHDQWKPNLIWFDNTRVLLTPNYYAQALFARNRPEAVWPTLVTGAAGESTAHGRIGVGTWKTEAEYRDIRVTAEDGQVLFDSNSSPGLKGWETAGGEWSISHGTMRQGSPNENVRAVIGEASWHDYTLTLRARKLGGSEGFLILFATTDLGAPTWWNIGGWGNSAHYMEGSMSNPRIAGSVKTGCWYDIRLELRGSHVKGYLNGKLIQEGEYKPTPQLYAVGGRSQGAVVLDVVNVSPENRTMKIHLDGIHRLAKTARITVLASASGDDENILGEPPKVTPQTRAVRMTGSDFIQEFPANSLTILRMPVK